MNVLNIEAYKQKKREQWKADVLSFISRELDKIHDTNFEDVEAKMKDYAEDISQKYARPNEAKEQRERLQQEFPELCK